MRTPTRPGPMVAAAALVTLAAGLAGWTGMAPVVASSTDPAARLASHLGLSVQRLSQLVVAPERLLDGTELLTLKAVDTATGDIVGVTLAGDRAVDRRAEIARAGAAWRAVNGALTPALLELLGRTAADVPVEVDVWFGFDPPEALALRGPARPLHDEPTADLQAELAAALAAEADAALWGATRDPGKTVEDAPLSGTEAAAVLADAAPMAGTGVSAATEKSADEQARPDVSEAQEAAARAALAEQDARDADYLAELGAALVAVRMPVLDALAGAGAEILETSDVVPSVIIRADKATLFRASRLAGIDAMYPRSPEEQPELGNARVTQNANLVTDAGASAGSYTGTGVAVAVTEGGRVFGENPFLTVDSYCNAGAAGSDHATAVAGFIASTHATHRGLARNVTLRSANCAASVEARVDWGASNARVLNHSFFSENNPGSGSFNALDRRLDYIARVLADFPVKSSGNVGNGCVSNGFSSNFVTSPGKGYNTMTVGNFNDLNTQGWGDDAMANCSSFGNPTGDSASGSHQKPEMVAVGTNMQGTLVSTNSATAVGGVGGGTSYSAPQVAATAANMIQADTSLGPHPQALKPILMAGALHNIEGAARLSDRDGAGALVAATNLVTVERGHFDFRSLAAADLPFNLFMLAKAGERVRVAIHWQSNPNAAYTSDPLPADIDLRVYRGDGTTLVASSTSVNNPFEIVDFVAPETDIFQIRVSLFGSWSGGGTWFGGGWWRGVDRLSNGYWQSGSTPGPMGHHYELRPTEATPSNYWHGVAVRPNTADYDLQLYDRSWFDDPAGRQMLNSSALAGSALDFVLVDGNHWPSGNRQFWRVRNFSGTGSYQLSAGKHGTLIGANTGGLLGPYTLNAVQSLFIADISFSADSMRRIRLIPAAGSNDDFGLSLFRSTGTDAATWTRRRGQAVAQSDTGGVGAGEAIRYRYDGTSSDWLGLAVFNKTYNSAAEFYLQVKPSSLFNDGFETW
ncbi:MAG: S8 family serine peptidase [Pseudoxanthomonas sp.]|nr:S8 family serine peptidase [Pseudoxanthomonas sp.]